MNNLCNTYDWKKWYPEKIKLQEIKKNITYNSITLNNSSYEKKINKHTLTIYRKLCANQDTKKSTEKYSKDFIKNEKIGYSIGFNKGRKIGYSIGFNKGLKQCKSKLQCFIKDFHISLNSIDSVISQRLLIVVTKILNRFSNYSQKIKNNKFLLQQIKDLLAEDLLFTKNLQIHVNPKDKKLVNTYFKKIFKQYNWIIYANSKISRNSLKIISKQTNFDTTLPTCWKELCKIIIKKSGQ